MSVGSEADVNALKQQMRAEYADRTEFERTQYRWHLTDILDLAGDRERVLAELLHSAVGSEPGSLDIVDVGCGTGTVVHGLAEWGADPTRLIETESPSDRISRARVMSPTTIRSVPLPVDQLGERSRFELVIAHVVFVSLHRFLRGPWWRSARRLSRLFPLIQSNVYVVVQKPTSH